MHARFLAACGQPDQFPAPTLPEVAVAGRSNCGKSSLINALTGVTALARTSQTPGRTRQIVFFAFELPGLGPIHLVDLPGYGFARAARFEIERWEALVQSYLRGRSGLELLLLLVDIRRKPAAEEREVLSWAAAHQLHALVVLTKADKLAKSRRHAAADLAMRELTLARRPLVVSARDRSGVAELRGAIAGVLTAGRALG